MPPFRQVAQEVGCTPAQLALAWLLHKAPDIVLIPGTTSVAHLHEDLGAAEVRLSEDVLTRVGALINQDTVKGHRYNAQAIAEVDTEEFPHA